MTTATKTLTPVKQLANKLREIHPVSGWCANTVCHTGKSVHYDNAGCHASFGSAMKKYPYLGQCYRYGQENKYDKEIQAYLEFITGPESPYKPLLDELGKKFYVIRDDRKKIIGWATSRNDVNHKILFNFYKSIRFINEHPSMLEFWYKWAVQRKKHPRLAWILAAFWTKDGQQFGTGHGPLESERINPVDLRKVLDNNHSLWDVTDTSDNDTGYGGEQRYCWKGSGVYGFDLRRSIPVVTKKEVPTRFWTKYYGAGRKNLGISDETLENFFDNIHEIYKEG